MAAPKPAIIVLLLVIVALVAFFVVGVGLGAGDKPPPSREQKLAWRQKLFGSPPPVARTELTAIGCQGDPKLPVIPLGRLCHLEIDRGATQLRSLAVVTRDGVRVVFTPKGKAKTAIQVKLDPKGGDGNKVDLPVQKDGGTLELTCLQPLAGATAPCAVALQ